MDEYDKFYKEFRDKIDQIDNRLVNLQKAEDDYYLTTNYLLQLANKAYDLFVSSEIEEKRQILKLVLQNLRVEGKLVRYDAIKPFDTILNFADRQAWLPKPRITIPENSFIYILQTFQNPSYIGEMRQRWEEIKKLQNSPSLALF